MGGKNFLASPELKTLHFHCRATRSTCCAVQLKKDTMWEFTRKGWCVLLFCRPVLHILRISEAYNKLPHCLCVGLCVCIYLHACMHKSSSLESQFLIEPGRGAVYPQISQGSLLNILHAEDRLQQRFYQLKMSMVPNLRNSVLGIHKKYKLVQVYLTSTQ